MKKENKIASFFGRLFGNRNKQLSFMEEEQLQSPTRMIVRNFMGNKLGMMKASVEVALKHKEIGEDFKEYLKEIAKTL